MRLLAAALLATLSAASLAADRPDTWAEWKQSKVKANADAVKVIEAAKNNMTSLCVRYGRAKRAKTPSITDDAAVAYVDSVDGLTNGLDLMNIKKREVEVGMTICGAIAAIGEPDKINHSANAYGERAQLVYRKRQVYVYAQRAKHQFTHIVTSVQW